MLGKTSLDPNNKFWANEHSRFGYQMLLKMGWNPKMGLGKNEQGATRHVTVALKDDRAGLGAPTEDLFDWLQSSKEYSSTLSALSQIVVPDPDTKTNTLPNVKEKKEEIDKQEKTVQSKTHKHFIPGRTIQGKNVSSYSKDDLSAIFGFESAPSRKEVSKTPVQGESKDFTNSTQTINEYFEKKKTEQDYLSKKRKCPVVEKESKRKRMRVSSVQLKISH